MVAKEKNLKTQISPFIPDKIKQSFKELDNERLKKLEEIRLRSNRPVIFYDEYGEWYISSKGELIKDISKAIILNQDEIIKSFELMSENSIYAYQEEIRNGFITLKGGHRVGIAGRIVLEDSKIKNIRDISGLNIRISKEVIGCCKTVIKYILSKDYEVYNTLIISPPQCGKTTLLRDITRYISDGEEDFKGKKVGVVDERSEIGACFKGLPQNNIGMRTDILDACPKNLGMMLMLRSMSPDVIVTDEIGNVGDQLTIMQLVNAGIKIITTAHGYDVSNLRVREEVLKLIEDKIFERIIVLSNFNGPGTVEEVLDGSNMTFLYRRV